MCVFRCTRGKKLQFWCVLCRDIITRSTTCLSFCPQCWLSSVAVCPRLQQLGHRATTHLPQCVGLLLFLLRGSCPRSQLIKMICHTWYCHPAVQQSYWGRRTSHDFSAGCHFSCVDVEFQLGFFVPYLPVSPGNGWPSVEGAAPISPRPPSWELPYQVLLFCLCCRIWRLLTWFETSEFTLLPGKWQMSAARCRKTRNDNPSIKPTMTTQLFYFVKKRGSWQSFDAIDNSMWSFYASQIQQWVVWTLTHEDGSTVVHSIFFFFIKREFAWMHSVFPNTLPEYQCSPTFKDAPSIFHSADRPSDWAQDRLLKLHITWL